MEKVYKIEEIKNIFDSEKPKFVGLLDPNGKWEVAYNSPRIKNTIRFAEIEKAIKKKSLPDGIYWFCYRNTLTKGSTEYKLPLAKGNITQMEVMQPSQTKITPTKVEEVWTSKEAVEILSDKNKTELILQMKEKELQDLKAYVAELEKEEDLEEEETETDPKGFMDGLNKLVEMLTPVIDKHFQLREKELDLKERGLTTVTPKRNGQQQNPEMRTDGGIKFDSSNYENYFSQLVEHADEETFQYECSLLEKNNPGLYINLMKKFNIEIENNSDGK